MTYNLSTGLNIRHVVLAVFLITNFVIGLVAGRSPKDLKDYALANRRFGTGVLTITFLATYINGNIINSPIIGFSPSLFEVLAWLTGCFKMIWVGMVIAPRILSFQEAFTMGDIMGSLYGRRAKALTGYAAFFFSIFIAAAQIVAIGTICSRLLGINTQTALTLCGGALVLYAAIGGVRSVTVTDVFQFLGLIIVLAVVSNVGLQQVGGLPTLFLRLGAEHPERLQGFLALNPRQDYVLLAAAVCMPIYILSPPFVQRMLMNRQPDRIRRMFFTIGTFLTLCLFLFILIGLVALTLHPKLMPGEVMTYMIGHYFSAPMQAVLAVAIVAVAMSTADSFLNAAGLALAHDVVAPFLTTKKINFDELAMARWLTFAMGCIAIWLAPKLYGTHIAILINMGLMFLGTITVPFIAGVMRLKPDKHAFWLAIAAFALTLVVQRLFVYKPPIDFFKMRCLLFGAFAANAIVFFAVHAIKNKGFVSLKPIYHDKGKNDLIPPLERRWVPSIQNTVAWIADYCPTPKNVLRYSRRKVKQHGDSATLFGLFLVFVYLMPFLLEKPSTRAYLVLIAIRAIGMALAVGLMLKTAWPKRWLRDFFPFYYHFTLGYCLPFTTTLLFCLGLKSLSWELELAVGIVILAAITDLTSFWVIASTGVVTALALSRFLYPTAAVATDFDVGYRLFVAVSLSIAVAVLFIIRKPFTNGNVQQDYKNDPLDDVN